MSSFASSEESKTLQKGMAGYILIVFTDTNVYRRSLDSAPVIGSGKEDYSIKIGCLGRSDCIARIKSIYELISIKKQIVKSCKKPIYARVTINSGSIEYSEGEKDEVDVYDIDYTGKCVNYLGVSYKIEESIFEILNAKAIREW